VDKADDLRAAALAALPKLYDAVPRGKFARVQAEAETVEDALRRGLEGLRLLHQLRLYFLDTTGEESPFVQRIDKLIAR
jgi:hypothetical protein